MFPVLTGHCYLYDLYILDRINSTLRGVSLPTFHRRTPSSNPNVPFRIRMPTFASWMKIFGTTSSMVRWGKVELWCVVALMSQWFGAVASPRTCKFTKLESNNWWRQDFWRNLVVMLQEKQGCFGWRSNVPQMFHNFDQFCQSWRSYHYSYGSVFCFLYGLPRSGVIQKFHEIPEIKLEVVSKMATIMPFARTVSTFTLDMSPCAHVKLILGPSLRNFSLPGLLASHAEVAHSQAASEKYSKIDPTGGIGRAFKM